MHVPLWAWAATLALVLVLLAADLVAHRRHEAVTVRDAAGWSVVWVAVSLAFGGVVWAVYGGERGGEWYAGYLVEKALAVDNVFVFALVFTAFGVPRALQHRVLFLGVLGALVFRGVFVALGAVLLERFHAVLYALGALLVVSGLRMFRTREAHPDPAQHPVVRLTRRLVPVTDGYRGARLVVREAGRLVATPLLVVLVLVEVTDVVFAVDSVPAVFAITQEPFLVFTSNAFAVLGLRAAYFLLADLMHRFVHLKAGLSAVLVVIGLKMVLIDVVHVPTWASLLVVAALLTTSVVTSLRATRGLPPSQTESPSPAAAPSRVEQSKLVKAPARSG